MAHVPVIRLRKALIRWRLGARVYLGDFDVLVFEMQWLSFLHRYVPVGLLDVVPQKMIWRPPAYFARSDLETLLSSDSAADWVKISEMLLGPTPKGFVFNPKHKSNSYATVAPAGAAPMTVGEVQAAAVGPE